MKGKRVKEMSAVLIYLTTPLPPTVLKSQNQWICPDPSRWTAQSFMHERRICRHSIHKQYAKNITSNDAVFLQNASCSFYGRVQVDSGPFMWDCARVSYQHSSPSPFETKTCHMLQQREPGRRSRIGLRKWVDPESWNIITPKFSHNPDFKLVLLMTGTLTAYLTPKTRLSTPRLRYCVPKSASQSSGRAPLLLPLPYKKPCCP